MHYDRGYVDGVSECLTILHNINLAKLQGWVFLDALRLKANSTPRRYDKYVLIKSF
jgi:hypothetical protein